MFGSVRPGSTKSVAVHFPNDARVFIKRHSCSSDQKKKEQQQDGIIHVEAKKTIAIQKNKTAERSIKPTVPSTALFKTQGVPAARQASDQSIRQRGNGPNRRRRQRPAKKRPSLSVLFPLRLW